MSWEAQTLSFYTKIVYHVGPPSQRTAATAVHTLPSLIWLLLNASSFVVDVEKKKCIRGQKKVCHFKVAVKKQI